MSAAQTGITGASAPTAIAEINALADVKISCDDGDADCEQPQCEVSNPTRYKITATLQSAAGVFASSYGNQGFSVTDGTGGILVLIDGESSLQRGDKVMIQGTTTCQFGTLALDDTVVKKIRPQVSTVFAPKQIGQLSKPPKISGDPDVTPNWCDCLQPFSATSGNVIAVRGTAVADLEDDGEFGFKLFIDDGNGVAQIFIDASADVSVERLRRRLLVQGEDLCIRGVVALFAGVGYELLPRSDRDFRRAKSERKNPCQGF
ncbi:MAG: hypothetical protein AAGI44_04135 [Pseudomonadota bacterium]